MKGAQARIVLSGLFQHNTGLNHLDNIGPGEYFIYKFWCNHGLATDQIVAGRLHYQEVLQYALRQVSAA